MNAATRQDGDTGTSASFADLVIQMKENRKTQSTAALPTEAVNKVASNLFNNSVGLPPMTEPDRQTDLVNCKAPELFQTFSLVWLHTFRIFQGNLVLQTRRFQLSLNSKMFCCESIDCL